jgi:hypothetical protein
MLFNGEVTEKNIPRPRDPGYLPFRPASLQGNAYLSTMCGVGAPWIMNSLDKKKRSLKEKIFHEMAEYLIGEHKSQETHHEN